MLHQLFHKLGHGITGVLGALAAFLPSFDTFYRGLGAAAIVVSIYCSLDRNAREKRAAARAEGRPE